MSRTPAGRGTALWAVAMIVGAVIVGAGLGCTEPNPYLPHGVGSSGGSEGSGTSTTSVASTGAAVTSSDDGGSSSSGVASSPCAEAGLQCVPEAPEGFGGPFAWLERPADGARPACPEPFPELLVEAFSDISAPAARCGCSCGAFNGASCDGEATVDLHGGGACGGDPVSTQVLVSGCNPLPGPGWSSSSSYYYDAPEMVGGGCIPLPESDRVPAAFLTRHLACAAPPSTTGCDAGEQCIPAPSDPFDGRLCVWHEGDVACPEGAYAERTLLHRAIEDDRGCQPCTCARPTGPCMSTSVALSTSIGCAGIVGGIAPDSCTPGPGGLNLAALVYNPGTPAGECTPAVVVPTGDASGREPVTFCCTP